MDRTVELLIEGAKNRELWAELYERALFLLERLPLTTQLFTVAEARLRNALAYAVQEEYGAAAFELRLLRGVLAND